MSVYIFICPKHRMHFTLSNGHHTNANLPFSCSSNEGNTFSNVFYINMFSTFVTCSRLWSIHFPWGTVLTVCQAILYLAYFCFRHITFHSSVSTTGSIRHILTPGMLVLYFVIVTYLHIEMSSDLVPPHDCSCLFSHKNMD